MNSKDLILGNLELTREMILGLAEDMADHCLTFPTLNGGNHAMWIIGHLAFGEGTLIDEWALGQSNPCADSKEIFSSGLQPVADPDVYPNFAEVLRICREVREHTINVLQDMQETDLDQRTPGVPSQYRQHVPTIRDCFNMTSLHWLEHKGQLADARRAAGLPVRFY